jgi:hypothetical protein
MLPDYPKIKARLVEKLMDRMKLVHKSHLSVFGDVPPTIMHEGGRYVLTREDGSVEEMTPQLMEAEATLEFDMKEAEKLELPQILNLIDNLAEELARKGFTLFLQRMNEAVTKVGNVSDPSKKGVEAFFDCMEKRRLDFDENGQPEQADFLVGSEEMAEKLRDLLRQIKESPELRRRYEAIIEKKREEWRDREIARNLVE